MPDRFDTPEGQRQFLEHCLKSFQQSISEMQQIKVRIHQSHGSTPIALDDDPKLLQVIQTIRELKATVDDFQRDLEEITNEGKTP